MGRPFCRTDEPIPWARASSLDRHLECPAASHLPRLDRGKWEPGYLIPPGSVFVAPTVAVAPEDRFAADWGTAMHAAKAGAPDAVDPFLTWMEPHRDRLWPARLGQHEVAVAYNCRDGSVLEYRGADADRWKESLGPDYVTGSCDWWATLPTGEPWIDDLKTGWREPEVVTPQTLFYLMVRLKVVNAARVEGQDEWITGRISITHWPRAKEPTEPVRHWRQVSDTVLLAFEGDIKRAWVRATGLNPEPRPGAHCLYCPSATVCDRANG